MNKKEIEKAKTNLDALIKIQCYDGNWNYEPYMLGLLNGLLLARVTIFGGRFDPVDPPKKWKKKSWLGRIIDRFVNKPLKEE
jgi:hypothetical protein